MTRSINALIGELSAGGRRPYAAMAELVEQGEVAITPLVIALRETRDTTVRDRIASTLTRIGKAAIPALSSVYSSEIDPKIRSVALDALGEIGDPAALPVLTSALRDSDNGVRHLAAYGVKQIREANPEIGFEPRPVHGIEQAEVAPPQPATQYRGTWLAESPGPSRRPVSGIIKQWIFGIDLPETIDQQVGNPFARWILRPFRKGLASFLSATLLVYAMLCIWEGYAWSTQLSPTYGLRIVRIIVVALLSLVSVVTLPFRAGFFLLFAVINVALLFFPLGALHGFTLSPEGERYARHGQRPEILLLSLIAIGSMPVAFGYDILTENFDGFIIGYLLESPLRILVVGAGIFLLVARNIYYNTKGQQPVQQPLI